MCYLIFDVLQDYWDPCRPPIFHGWMDGRTDRLMSGLLDELDSYVPATGNLLLSLLQSCIMNAEGMLLSRVYVTGSSYDQFQCNGVQA